MIPSNEGWDVPPTDLATDLTHPEHGWLQVADLDCPSPPRWTAGEPALPSSCIADVAGLGLRLRSAYRAHNELVFGPGSGDVYCLGCVDRVLEVLEHPRHTSPQDHQLLMAYIEEEEEHIHQLRPWLDLALLATAYGYPAGVLRAAVRSLRTPR